MDVFYLVSGVISSAIYCLDMATGHENLDEMSKDEILLESNRPSTSKVDSELSILNVLSSLQDSMDSMAIWAFLRSVKIGQFWPKPISRKNARRKKLRVIVTQT